MITFGQPINALQDLFGRHGRLPVPWLRGSFVHKTLYLLSVILFGRELLHALFAAGNLQFVLLVYK
jgi:hypothetical protein